MATFFESDRDEIRVGDSLYLDFFNLYPDLQFASTLRYLNSLNEIAVVNAEQSADGWQIEARFHECGFLIDTHYHGTSTLFCAKQGVADDIIMLAFLGCFLPLFRDSSNSG